MENSATYDGTVGRSRLRDFAVQVAIYASAYVVYQLARGLAVGDVTGAVAHAQEVFKIEGSLHLNVEDWVQSELNRAPIIEILDRVYLLAQFAVVPLTLLLTFWRSRPVYRTLRNTLFAAWLIAIPIYALLPTAPPRLAGIGLMDTVSDQTGIHLDDPSMKLFYNPYAAVPSLHVGFAFAVGFALAAIAPNRPLRLTALAWGPLVTLATIATGNHFVLDAVAGLAVVGAGYAVALRVERRSIWSPAADVKRGDAHERRPDHVRTL